MQPKPTSSNPIIRGINYILDAWLIIALTSVCSGLLIFLSIGLQPRIDKNQLALTSEKLRSVIPGSSVSEILTLEGTQVLKVEKDSKHVGWGIKARGKGWGDIEILIVLDPKAETLLGIGVLGSEKETPGLGSKINAEAFTQQFTATPEKPMRPGTKFTAEKGTPGANQIKAITGATISSRGVTDAINQTLTPALIAGLQDVLKKEGSK